MKLPIATFTCLALAMSCTARDLHVAHEGADYGQKEYVEHRMSNITEPNIALVTSICKDQAIIYGHNSNDNATSLKNYAIGKEKEACPGDLSKRDPFIDILVKVGTFTFSGTLTLGQTVGVGVLAGAIYAGYKYLNKETSSTEVTANSKRASESVFTDIDYDGNLNAEKNDVDEQHGDAFQGATQAFVQMVHDNNAAGGCGTFAISNDGDGAYTGTEDFGVVEAGVDMKCAGAQ